MKYLILSEHRPTLNRDMALWWLTKCKGYTADTNLAGRYGKREATDICVGSGGRERMIPEREARAMVRQFVIYNDIPNVPRRRR